DAGFSSGLLGSSAGFRLLLYFVMMAMDLLAITAGTMLAFAVHPSMHHMSSLMPLLAILPLYIIMALFSDAYDKDAVLALQHGWGRATKAFLITVLLIVVLASPFNFEPPLPSTLFLTGVVTAYALLISG